MATFLGLTTLTVAIIAVIGVAAFALFCIWVWIKIIEHKESRAFWRLKNRNTEINVTGADMTRTMLDQFGLVNVEIERVGFFRSMFRGNTYSARKKKVYLNKFVYDRSALLGLASINRVVGLAKLDADGNKNVKRVSNILWLQSTIALIIPAVIISVIIDGLMFAQLGVISIVACCVGIVIFIVVSALAISTAKVVKQADKEGLDLLEAMAVLTDDELNTVKKLSKLNYKIYIANIILTSVFILKLSAQLVWSILKIGSKK